MLKKMKNKNFFNLLIFLLCLNNGTSFTPPQKTPLSLPKPQFTNYQEQLSLEKKISFYKLILIPSLIGSLLLYNKKNLLEGIKKNPFVVLVGGCIISNFYIDAAIKYREINDTMQLFQLSKTISRYLLYASAIKNTMLQVAKRDACCDFKEDVFLKMITNEIPLSFQELELFAFELLHSCIKTIHTLHIKIHTDIEEQIYLLCKEHIALEDILIFYENDAKIYPLLQKLQENPNQYYKNTALELNTLIKEQFQYMINRQPKTF